MPKALTQAGHSSRVEPYPVPEMSTTSDHIVYRERPSSAWSTEDDNSLLQHRKQGLNWNQVAEHFPGKTANACRKRHERLMERQNNNEWDSIKTEDLAAAYFECRELMWKIMAEYLGENEWQTLETKCMEKGFKNLQTAARGARRASLKFSMPGSDDFDDSGLGGLDSRQQNSRESPAPRQSQPPPSQYQHTQYPLATSIEAPRPLVLSATAPSLPPPTPSQSTHNSAQHPLSNIETPRSPIFSDAPSSFSYPYSSFHGSWGINTTKATNRGHLPSVTQLFLPRHPTNFGFPLPLETLQELTSPFPAIDTYDVAEKRLTTSMYPGIPRQQNWTMGGTSTNVGVRSNHSLPKRHSEIITSTTSDTSCATTSVTSRATTSVTSRAQLPTAENSVAKKIFRDVLREQSVARGQDTKDQQDHIAVLPAKPTIETTKPLNTSHHQTTPETLTDRHSRTLSPYSELSLSTTTKELNSVAQKLISDLVTRIVPKCLELAKDSINNYTESHSESYTSTPQQSDGKALATGHSGALKHRRPNNEEDGEEYQDGDGDRRQTKKELRTVPTKVKMWACPYTKFDPIRYSEHNQHDERAYRKCASATLMNISTVKQHLRRVHLEPKYFCGNCYEKFKEKEDLHQHNQVFCERGNTRYEEMITEKEYQLIPKYLADTVPSWNQIFQILFKDTPLPASPFVSHIDVAVLQQFIALFRFVGPNEFLELLSARPRPNDLLLESNLSLRNLIEETYENAFPEYLQQLRAVTNENPSNENDSTVVQNPQLATPQNSDNQVSEVSNNAQSTFARPWDIYESAGSQELIPTLGAIDEAFASFEANVYSESYFEDNEAWMDEFSTFIEGTSRES